MRGKTRRREKEINAGIIMEKKGKDEAWDEVKRRKEKKTVKIIRG